MIKIDREKCIKCGACVKDCITKAIKTDEKGFPQVAPEDERFCSNCQHCLAVCPTGAVTCHDVTPENCFSIGQLPSPDNMLNLLRQRRSIRQYKAENLDKDTLDKLKDSLAWMPTGCNDHRLFFAVIEDRNEMDFFRAKTNRLLKLLIKSGILRLIYPGYKRYLDDIMNGKDLIYQNAPHMIVAATPRNAPCKEADPWIALSYFDLYAQSLGAGTCWCGFACYIFKWHQAMRHRLKIPKGYKIGAVMLFGKPDVSYARSTCPSKPLFKE